MNQTQTQARTRVMIVDDDAVVLEITRERLEDAGYDVVVQLGGLGTGAAAFRERPEFVLLDVNMPALRGDAIAKLLSTSTHKPTVILHSSESERALAALTASCGAVGAVQKTSDAGAFLRQFEDCVRRARA